MKIIVMPSYNYTDGEISYDDMRDTMWVYAECLPRDYNWDVYDIRSIEGQYLTACIKANIWLRHFVPDVKIHSLIVNKQFTNTKQS